MPGANYILAQTLRLGLSCSCSSKSGTTVIKGPKVGITEKYSNKTPTKHQVLYLEPKMGKNPL